MQVLDLPKSRIALHRDEMVKYGPGETAIARYPTDQIRRIGLERSRELGAAIVIIGVFVSLAYVAHRYVASPGWSWTAVIVCLGICGFAFLGIEGRKLVIETPGGTVRYPVADLFEEAEGFVVSANALLALSDEECAGAESAEKQLVSLDS
jgi:hypothetical protein